MNEREAEKVRFFARRYGRKMTNLDSELKKYEIWCEGYVITGSSSGAWFKGEMWAHSFQEACDKLMKDDSYYNSSHLTYWGCKLFDNQVDAVRTFG